MPEHGWLHDTVPALSDGSLDVFISRDKSQGEPSMMGFIKMHMGEILRPFGEQVEQLHQTVNQLCDDLAANDASTREAHEQLVLHKQMLKESRSDIDKVLEHRRQLQATIGEAQAAQVTLDADLVETKLRLEKVNSNTQALAADANGFRMELNEVKSTSDSMQWSIKSTSKKMSTELEPTVQNHATLLNGLDSRYSALKGLLNQVKDFGERSHGDFQVHIENRTKQNRMDKESFAELRQQNSHLSAMLTESINRLNTHSNHLRTTNAAVQSLKAKVEDLTSNQRTSQQQHRDSFSRLDQLQVGFDKTIAEKKKLQALFSSGSKQEDPDIYGDFFDLQTNFAKHMVAFRDLEDILTRCSEASTLQEKRIQRLEGGQTSLESQTKSLQEQVGVESMMPTTARASELPLHNRGPPGVSDGVGVSGDVKSAAALARFQVAVKTVSVREGQRELRKRVDVHENSLEVTDRFMEETKQDLDVQRKRLATVEQALVSTKQQVGEVKSGLELSDEYWRGLSSGFRETHRAIRDHEFLPPRASSTLPTLKTPRTRLEPAGSTGRGSICHGRSATPGPG